MNARTHARSGLLANEQAKGLRSRKKKEREKREKEKGKIKKEIAKSKRRGSPGGPMLSTSVLERYAS